VKELEERGIGRPSTYSTILSTIQEREYAVKEKNRLKPTILGCAVIDLLVEGFPEVMDVQFTADMEEDLDKVEEGNVNWVELLKRFYKGFSKRLNHAETSMRSLRHEGVPTEIDCDQCGAQMIIKWGKRGEFLSCSRYPDCKNAKQFEYGNDGEIRIKERREPEIRYDILCDLCGKPMVVRTSRFGKFLGCSGYPECKNTKRLQNQLGNGEESKEEKQRPRRKFFKKSGRKEAKA
jgi:DNA topoisomerase-1